MKVLFQSYFDIGRGYGGGPSVVHNLAAELTKLGVQVDYHSVWESDPKKYDLSHYFSCYDQHNWLRHWPDDPPLVVTPISWFARSRRKALEDELKFLARAARHRSRDRRRLGYPAAFPDHWFPNSEGEAALLGSAYAVARSAMSIVPHGVSRRFAEGEAEPFVRKFGLRDFVLCVGRFEAPRKNQLALVQAMRGSDIPLVFIGSADAGQAPYLKACEAEAGRDVRFLPPLDHGDPLLVSAYFAAKVVVMPALLESPGLAGLEGALAGANVATTDGGSTREYYGEHAWYFDPLNRVSMHAAIKAAYEAPRKADLRQRVAAHYTWDKIAATQLAAYQRIAKA